MAISQQERSIRYAVAVLRIIHGRLWTMNLPTIEMALREPPTDGDADVEKVTREILDLAVLVQKACEHLIDNDSSRQLWAEAVDCLRYREAPAEFDELWTAIITCLTSCRWAPAFHQRVLMEQTILDHQAWNQAAVTERAECKSLATVVQAWPGNSG